MQRPQRETVTLDDILITEELSQRPDRLPNLLAENQALHTLARQLVHQPETMLQTLVDMALDLCSAGTVGVSLLEATADGEVFRWTVLAGTLAQSVGGTIPRNFSPCGVCLDRGTLVLFAHPERYFTYFQAANTLIVEGLVLPLIADNHVLGTIWIMSHDSTRHFDSEDVRVMTSLADFTAANLHLQQRQTQELLAKNAQLEAEIIERKRTEKTAREAEAYFRAIANLVPDMLWRNDATGNTSWYNDRWLDYTGQTLEEAQGYGWLKVIHPSDRAQSLTNFQNAVDQRRPLRQEHRIRGKDGNYRWFQVQAEPTFDADGQVTQWFGAAIDIHEQRLINEALRESEQRLRVLVENLPGGAVFVVDRDLRYLLAEGEALAVAGFKPEDLIGHTIFEVMPPELVPKYEAMYQKALFGESFEHEHNAHDRTYISRGMPLRAENGEIYAVLAVSYDISDRKQAEQAPRESQARLQLIANLVPDLLWDSEPNGSTNWYNQRWMEYTGQTFEQAIGWGWRDAIHPDDRQGSARRYREAVEQGMLLLQEHRIRRHDGTYRWFVVKASPLKDESGKVIKMYSAATDIHEQRVALETLRDESEAKYRTLFTSIDEGFTLLEMIPDSSGHPADFRIVETNPAWEQQTGLTDAAGKTLLEIAPNLEQQLLDFYSDVVISGRGRRTEYYTASTDHWYTVYASRIGGAGSRHLAVVFNDISDRKRSEEQLRRAADMDAFRVKLSDALRSLTDPVEIQAEACRLLGEQLGVDRAYYVEVHEAEGYARVNRHYSRGDSPSIVGEYPLAEYGWSMQIMRRGETIVVADTQSSNLVPDAERAAMAMLQMVGFVALPLIKGEVLVGALTLNEPTPREWTEAEVELVRETAERIWADIQRAHAETALHESEQKYRTLFDSIDEGLAIVEMIYDDQGEIVDIIFRQVNRAYERHGGVYNVVGRSIFDVIPSVEDYWLDLYNRVARTGESVREENYQQDVDRWFDVYFSRIDDNGRFVAIVFSDISDRKRAEQTLREREARQAFLLKLGDTLRAEPDANSVANRAVRMLAEHLHLDRFWLSEVFEQQDISTVGPEYHRPDLPPMSGVFRLSDYPETMRQLATQPMVIHDVTSSAFSEFEKALLDQLHLRALLIVALRKGQHQVIWAMAAAMTTPRHWNESERVLLEEVGEYVWAAIERARAEATLRESEAKYRSLFESINDAFALLEVLYDDDNRPIDCRFLEVSPSFETQTGLPQAQGKTLRELIPSVESDWFEHYHQALVTNALVHFEVYQEYLNIWFEVDVLPYGNPQDRQVTIVFQNINDRKQAEAERLQLIREQSAREQEHQRAETLAELDRAKTLFFSNVSHEFRTPLTLLLAPLQDALSDRTHPLLPIHRERLELAQRNSLRLLKLVNTLLDFSRIEAGRIEAVYEPTDLSRFTAELASVFRSAIEQAGLRLIVDCLPLPEPVYVDREMWEKIVLNLISNAFKFTLNGEIRVSLHPVNHHVIFEVQDTGTGIALEELPHLFERFYQVRGTQARFHEGSGIGLALVRELVQLQGGTINVSSTPCQGSCFTITLPFGVEHLPQERIKASRTLTSTSVEATAYVQEAELLLPTKEASVEFSVLSSELEKNSLTQNSQTARILLVDDNPDIRDYLTRILSKHAQVAAVADGAAALSSVQAQLPDLILSDVMMPNLDGFELLQALRSDPRTREIPIILLSARAGEAAIVEGLEAGADDYLIKPFSAQELVSRVNAHLHMVHLRGEALQHERAINRQKDELLSTVSHELNTPLVSILGWTRLLRSKPPSTSVLAKALDTIERNATLQAKLVQDLLDISRITAGKLRLRLEPIELESVIETAIAAVLTAAIAKSIRVEFEKPTDEPAIASSASTWVLGDANRLQQIVCNLLTNAIKFTPSGSITVELARIKGKNSDVSFAEIRVIDTGIGIASEFLPYVFDRFRQAESGSAGGLGLGLAIARHLVELHNGTIYAESAGEAQGATFIVRLPLLKTSNS
ncbi:multi-sensor signal transduction histidine kinase [Gloeocapsa sp. PCC 7428]|uniref:PAS domain S-box protein n=1 Tax=Gloeocapsa sp. PCC 7428 TaxID=1173026 RepID=UPI0002A61E7D|nr:PAS domain S-box protein [Gloeocapsa sp. PCC 7428]AFZ31248.1 multi-sensor signal transduction histidine kinase [Gloeocapsa sp. PCC 7428]